MELISVHVPKTAGVTFRTLLRDVYGAQAVHLDYGDRALDPVSTFQTDPARWRAESSRTGESLPPETRVIHGHFGGAKYDQIYPGARKIVWLRDPVARLVSHYHYWCDLPPTAHSLHRRLLDEKLSLLEFARLDGMRNILARVFLRDCRLEDFTFVGVQEKFAKDLRSLGRLLGWPSKLSVGAENRNPRAEYRAATLSKEEHGEIAALNAEDMAIYRKAFEQRHST